MTCRFCSDTGFQVSCITGQPWECLECKPKLKTMSFGPGKRSIPREFKRYQNSLVMARTMNDILEHYRPDGSPIKGYRPVQTEQYSMLHAQRNNGKSLSIDVQKDFIIPPDPPDRLWSNFKPDSYKEYANVFESLSNWVKKEGLEFKLHGAPRGHAVKNITLSEVGPDDLIGLPVRKLIEEFQTGKVKMTTSDEMLEMMNEERRQVRDFFLRPAPPPQAPVTTIIITDGDDDRQSTPAQLKMASRNKWWDNLLG